MVTPRGETHMNKTSISRIIAIAAAIAAIIAFFLPYISATDDFREYINSRADEKVYSTVDLTIGDMADSFQSQKRAAVLSDAG